VEESLKKGENPITYKKRLAFEIVRQLNSEADANSAQQNFENTVQKGELPQNIIEITLNADDESFVNEDLLVSLNLVDSKSEAKRLFQQGGVTVNDGRVAPGDNPEITDGMILRVGKRNVVKLLKPS
jgi:tyrosyl-tRNA synthetase